MRDKLGRFTDKNKGSKNCKWLGDEVGYFGLHTWVQRTKGRARTCVECGSTKLVQWANLSKKYLRDASDWRAMCSVCHRRFDGITKLSREQAASVRNEYAKGTTQSEMAKKYGVHQSTISNLLNNKVQFYV